MSTPADWCSENADQAAAQDRRQMPGCVPGSLAHTGIRPLYLTGAFIDILVRHFSSAQLIEDPALRKAIWQDNLTTGILIEAIHRWRGDLVERRPAIVIKRNAYKNVRVIHADYVGKDRQGNANYATLWAGSHTLFCIHGTGASTEILASEVQRELTQFGPQLSQVLDLKRFQVVEVGQISELEESTENFVVPVTVGWVYEETWRLEQEALPLKSIQLSMPGLGC